MNFRSAAIIFCLTLGATTVGYGQEIEINFYIDDNVSTSVDTLSPYLVIRYTNRSSNSYYFPALAYSGLSTPIFRYPTSKKNLQLHCRDSIINYLGMYHGVRFRMPLSFIEYKTGEMWNLELDDGADVHEESVINFFLDLYYYVDISMAAFTLADLRHSCLIRKNPAFIFLKAYETEEQRVSLAGMKDAGIILSVCLASEKSSGKVYVRTPNAQMMRRTLPSRIKGFTLYQGVFNSNELIVDFSSYAKSH